MLSIVISVFNGEKYISKTIDSIISQEFKEYECIIIDDGSMDSTKSIVSAFIEKYENFRYYFKENGGYVSARKFGFDKINSKSEFVHFMDSDDILREDFYSSIIPILKRNSRICGLCSNHLLINEKGNEIGKSNYSPFLIPTRFWFRRLDEELFRVPFVSIFCWAKIIEPMVVLRRTAYEKTTGWDARFGKGKGNIGDGVLLFGEMSLDGEIWFLNKELYYYRKHPTQSTSDFKLNDMAKKKVISIWAEKCKSGIISDKEFRFAKLFFKSRIKIDLLKGQIKHELRFTPIKLIGTIILIAWYYLISTPLCFYSNKTIKRIL